MKNAGVYFILLSAAVFVGHASQDMVSCPPSYINVQDKLCLRALMTELTYDDARDECELVGGYIWEPRCLDEQVEGMLRFNVDAAWLGVEEVSESLVYTATNGEVEFTNWGFNESLSSDYEYAIANQTTQKWTAATSTDLAWPICQARSLYDGCYEPNVEYFNNDAGFEYDDIEECISLCQHATGCNFFATINDINGNQKCNLVSEQFKEILPIYGYFWGTSDEINLQMGRPVGNIIALDDPLSCQEACQADNRCRSFIFLLYGPGFDEGVCVLNYQRLPHRWVDSDLSPGENFDYFSGPKYCNHYDSECNSADCHTPSMVEVVG